jgi:hypothetical protein
MKDAHCNPHLNEIIHRWEKKEIKGIKNSVA